MAWKKKEKPLTEEEARKLAIETLSPLWHGSLPIVAAVPEGEKLTVRPLVADFEKKIWIFCFGDRSNLAGRLLLTYIHEWHERFSTNNTQLVLVLHSPYSSLFERPAVRAFMDRHKLQIPVCTDAQGELKAAFEVEHFPTCLIVVNGTILKTSVGLESLKEFENSIHMALRKSDPGLPLSPPFELPGIQEKDIGSTELGESFSAKLAFTEEAPSEKGKVYLKGDWVRGPEEIHTADTKAQLSFLTRGKGTYLIASSKAGLIEKGKILIECDGAPLYEKIAGQDVQFSDEGTTYVEAMDIRLVHILKDLPSGQHILTFRFPTANSFPIILYGLRFTE